MCSGVGSYEFTMFVGFSARVATHDRYTMIQLVADHLHGLSSRHTTWKMTFNSLPQTSGKVLISGTIWPNFWRQG